MSTFTITLRSSGAVTMEPASFESIYRAHVGAVSGFFARRTTDPQAVADLTSETFVRAITSLHAFQGRGSVRGWLLAIARAVYAQHVAEAVDGRATFDRLAGQIELHHHALEGLEDRIDSEQSGRRLLQQAARLPELERTAIELVDIAGLSPRDAARALGISPGALRVRLFRARTRLRKEATPSWPAPTTSSGSTSSSTTTPTMHGCRTRSASAGSVR
jgi:RNA polymerase sigma factor (sigma-70 family)